LQDRPFYFFFFSSRRRHTRWPRDWSSDVCSSDLFNSSRGQVEFNLLITSGGMPSAHAAVVTSLALTTLILQGARSPLFGVVAVRSEERRVGKECRSGGWQYNVRKRKERT